MGGVGRVRAGAQSIVADMETASNRSQMRTAAGRSGDRAGPDVAARREGASKLDPSEHQQAKSRESAQDGTLKRPGFDDCSDVPPVS